MKPFVLIEFINFRAEICRDTKVGVAEHQGVLSRTGKPVKGTLLTSVRDHKLIYEDWENFRILLSESNKAILKLKESLFIKRDKPTLNRNQFSQELILF